MYLDSRLLRGLLHSIGWCLQNLFDTVLAVLFVVRLTYLGFATSASDASGTTCVKGASFTEESQGHTKSHIPSKSTAPEVPRGMPQKPYGKLSRYTTLQSKMNAKLSEQRFWHCYENGLIKTIQMIPHNLYVSVKLTSLYCGLRIILVYPNPQ